MNIAFVITLELLFCLDKFICSAIIPHASDSVPVSHLSLDFIVGFGEDYETTLLNLSPENYRLMQRMEIYPICFAIFCLVS